MSRVVVALLVCRMAAAIVELVDVYWQLGNQSSSHKLSG
jgi:hypothetical protein